MWVQLPPLQPFMLRVAQMVRAPGCGPGGRRFETGHAPHGFLAQLVERQTEDLRVPGSIPGEPTTYGRMPESGQLGRAVNPLPRGCVGSNPTSPTIKYSAQLFYHDNGRRICYPIITKALAATADELSGQGRKRALCRAMLAGKKQYGVGHMKMFCMLESRHQKSTNSN